MLGVLVLGAVIGTLLSGPLTDLLTRSGHLAARVWVPAICNVAAGLVLIPGILTDSLTTALPFCFLGTALISAANPPLDAARLDIMPPGLWGRAESVRTFLRSIAQALAPLLFGGVSDLIAGFEPQKAPIGTHTVGPVSTATGDGLQITFLIMLVSLLAAGWFLWRARPTYPVDVATAGASVDAQAVRRRWRRRSRRRRSESPSRPVPARPVQPQPSERSGGDPAAPVRPRTADPAARRQRADRRPVRGRHARDAEADVPRGRRSRRAGPSGSRAAAAAVVADRPSATGGSRRAQPTERTADPARTPTEPLVRRRRPAPEWLSDRDSAQDDDATEPLVWPRDPPPDR